MYAQMIFKDMQLPYRVSAREQTGTRRQMKASHAGDMPPCIIMQ